MSVPPQRSRGPKGSYRPHAKYVPKSDLASPAAPTATATATATGDLSASSYSKPARSLTTSLRSSAPAQPSDANRGDGGAIFMRYLPQDEAVASGVGADAGGVDAVESQAVVDFLNDELCRILKMNPRDFWKEVAKNDSLHQFFDSYLQFRSRWYDFPHRGSKGMVAGVIVGEADLCRRVFLVLYRISSNRDPGAHASDGLSVKDHSALLQGKKLLDLPKLLDVCAIYGHENEDLTKSLVANAIKVQPRLLDNLGGVVSHFLSIVHTMYERCNTSLEVLASYGGDGGQEGFMQLSSDFLEVLDFINDSIMTFEAFADAYRPAVLHFSVSFETSYGNDELLNTLARLHDSLIPSILRGFSLASENNVERKTDLVIPDVVLSTKILSNRMVKFGWKLLDFCYLHGELNDGDNLFQSISKVFPFTVEDPSIRGDILVQTLKEMHGEAQRLVEFKEIGTFAENIEKNYKIFGRINSLCDQGWISLDEEQLQYLSRILNSSSLISPTLSSSINHAPVDEEAVLLDSKISQIQDLFPDYGRGFLKACLEVYNHDSEEVIQRILEGTLHEHLSSLDTSLEHIPPSNPIKHNVNDKGKAVLVEQQSSSSSSSSSSQKNPISARLDSSSTSQSSFGRFTRKSNDDAPDSEVLDSKSSKDAVRSAVLAAEFEYEDEYDDSFDDLGLSVAEAGFEETESLTDRINSSTTTTGKSMEADQGSGSRWNSQKKPLFYVKDGKNYSYKVSGSVGVASANDAAIWNQAQRELIHGLGRGGNLPFGAVKLMEDSGKEEDERVSVPAENAGRGNSGFRGRGGRRGGGANHYRKDRAMKKHFSGVSGY